MNTNARLRFNAIWDFGQLDPQYAGMCEENRILERKYFAVLESLPIEQQDIVQDFLMNCEGMSWRMLEIACEQMIFPEEKAL